MKMSLLPSRGFFYLWHLHSWNDHKNVAPLIRQPYTTNIGLKKPGIFNVPIDNRTHPPYLDSIKIKPKSNFLMFKNKNIFTFAVIINQQKS